ncbi:Hypothetical protein POVR2_LOCUS314 [uncultured virus]|nr:Hypothetical protein POVR2_LOCUS314 [uncultured virus]
MLELTQFQKSYNEIRDYFNSKVKGYSSTTSVSPVDTADVSVGMLAAVTLMLVHNASEDHYHPLNISSLPTYDLNTFYDQWEMFEPYADYILWKRTKNKEKNEYRKLYPVYKAQFVRYLAIAQMRGVTIAE